jgi:hypothetical protein
VERALKRPMAKNLGATQKTPIFLSILKESKIIF